MSSPNQAPSETTVLLVDSRPAGQSSRSLTRKQSEFSPQTLLIPVTLATTLAAAIPSTTLIELVRQAVCRLWTISHGDPATLRAGGPGSPELCDAPEVTQFYATVLAILGAIEGIMCMSVLSPTAALPHNTLAIAGCGIFSRISSRYGRKPAFLVVLVPAIMSSFTIAWSQHMSDWLSSWVFLAGMLFGVFSGPLGYLIDMYIVDECIPEDRYAQNFFPS